MSGYHWQSLVAVVDTVADGGIVCEVGHGSEGLVKAPVGAFVHLGSFGGQDWDSCLGLG